MPAFSFDVRGPRMIEDFTGPDYFGRATDVSFRDSDDQQIVESVVSLMQFEQLNRILFRSVPSESVLMELRTAMPHDALVDRDGAAIP